MQRMYIASHSPGTPPLSMQTSLVDAKGDTFTHGSGDCRVYKRTLDATILFDSFTQIYLVFCLCFIYIMPWYSLFYVLNALLDIRFKKK